MAGRSGAATNATTVRVEWPSGIVQELTRVASDQILTLTEPALIQVTISREADVVRLDWRAEPNTVYRLRSSHGLTAWDTTQTVTSDASGAATATVAPNAIARFCRVIKDSAATEDRVLDLMFLVDQLERWSVEDSMFRGRMDFGRIGVLGFSRGGQSAAAFARSEARCRAAVILDASLVGSTVQFGLQKPSLSIQSPGRDDRQLFNSAARDAYFLRIQGASHAAIGGWAFYPTADASTLRLTHEINRSVNAYTVWFLNRYLRDYPDPMPPIADHPLVLGLLQK